MKKYIYTYSHHKDEYDLCRMEMRAFFGKDTEHNYICSHINIDPSRSPFIKEKLSVLLKSKDLSNIKNSLKQFTNNKRTFKIYCLNNMNLGNTKKIPYLKRRQLERELGLCFNGTADLENPEMIYGILFLNHCWYFGIYSESESIWNLHVKKPRQYSTALNTRLARTAVNILVPSPENKRIIDPCCGIGTVLIEALSMGINIEGRDLKPLVCIGARENLAYFHLDGKVIKGPISDITDHYDGAIIDLPYNIFTHISDELLYDIIYHARRIADKVLFISIKNIDPLVEQVGFHIVDRCVARKQQFKRQLLLCE